MPKTLLVVDDSATMRKVFDLTFAGEDITVVTHDGAEGLLAKAREVRPNVAVVDVGLGQATGYEVVRALKSDPSVGSFPILLMYSEHSPLDEVAARASGASGSLLKPFESQVAIDKIRAALAVGAGRAAAQQPPAEQPPPSGALPPGSTPLRGATPLQRQAPPGGSGATPARTAFGATPTTPSARPAPAPAPAAPVSTVTARAPVTPVRAPTQPTITLEDSDEELQLGDLGAELDVPPIFAAAPAATPAAAAAPAATESAPRPMPAPSPARPLTPVPPTFARMPPAATPAPTPAAAGPAPARAPEPKPTPAAPPVASLQTPLVPSPALDGEIAQRAASLGLTPAQVDAVTALTREVVERVVWEVVPQLAEAMIREEIQRLMADDRR